MSAMPPLPACIHKYVQDNVPSAAILVSVSFKEIAGTEHTRGWLILESCAKDDPDNLHLLRVLHKAIKSQINSKFAVYQRPASAEVSTKGSIEKSTDHGTSKKGSAALRSLAIFAMEYGGVLVGGIPIKATASAAESFEIARDHETFAQTLICDAQTRNGPALIIFNSDVPFRWDPSPNSSIPSSASSTTTAATSDSDRLSDEAPEGQRKVSDAKTGFSIPENVEVPNDLKRFLDGQSQLHLLYRRNWELPDEYAELLPEGSLLRQAYAERLLANEGSTSPTRRLLVLFGSDGGHAEALAKRLSQIGRRIYSAQQVVCLPLDAVSDVVAGLRQVVIADAAAEEEESKAAKGAVAVIVSTAGQGEFPGNAKQFWKRAAACEDGDGLKGVKYGVFSLGDRLYWPKEPQYFCKAGRDLDAKLIGMGAEKVVDLGLGDDQEADKYEAEWRRWEPKFWEGLGWTALGEASDASDEPIAAVPADEDLKRESNYLRGTLKESLDDITTGCIPYIDGKLIKFHGIYQQDDREQRPERAALGIEPAYSFMARVRLPGGVCTPAQWLTMDALADKCGNGTLKVTTRQTFQLHGILKRNLKRAASEMNRACMDTIAACGDVNRNVIATSTPGLTSRDTQQRIFDISKAISEFVMPHTKAYHEIFLSVPAGETPLDSDPHSRATTEKIKIGGNYFLGQGGCPRKAGRALLEEGEEPLYGASYLPRKFKIAIAIPPVNDVDVFAHCLGFIAHIEQKTQELEGFTVTVGGGMGRTHNEPKTYPRVADVLGYCRPEDATSVSAAVMSVQRDFGCRNDRKHARFKYTVEDLGVDFVRSEVERRAGIKFEPARPFKFETRGDKFGWMHDLEGGLHLGLFIEGGRVWDKDVKSKDCLQRIAAIHDGTFRLTCNQNLIVCDVSEVNRPLIEAITKSTGMRTNDVSAIRQHSIACVALPTCPLAMAESERYLPSLITKVEALLAEQGLIEEEIVIRSTGCPNGCARPYVAEIALVGKSPGFYDLLLGGDFVGQRLNVLHKAGIAEEEILTVLKELFRDFRLARKPKEHFGDFVYRHLSLQQQGPSQVLAH